MERRVLTVSYEARDCGITRGMYGQDVKIKCPDIHLFKVPEANGKADITCYRDAGAEVIEVLSRFTSNVERASIDEAYIDLTELVEERLQKMDPENKLTSDVFCKTYVIGWDNKKSVHNSASKEFQDSALNEWLSLIYDPDTFDIKNLKLAVGAIIVEEIRASIFQDLGFQCSAGIAHNKVLAKLACGLHKPNSQTILPQNSVAELFKTIPIHKVRNLGGKLGDILTEQMGIKTMAELAKLAQQELIQQFKEKTGAWLYQLAQGIEIDEVVPRHLPKSIGCSKNFVGKTALTTKEEVKYWVTQFAQELKLRLNKDKEMNNRLAKLLTISCSQNGNHSSRSCTLFHYDIESLIHESMIVLKHFNSEPHHSHLWSPPITNLSISAGKFHDINSDGMINHSIKDFFSPQTLVNQEELECSNSILNEFNASTSKTASVSEMEDKNIYNSPKVKEKSGFFASKMKQIKKKNKKTTTANKDVISNFFHKNNSVNDKKTDTINNCQVSNEAAVTILQTNDERNSSQKSSSEQINESILSSEPNLIGPESYNTVLNNPDLCETCSKCRLQIPVWESQEHADYHLAEDLQSEMQFGQVVTKSSNDIKNGKRKIKQKKITDKKSKSMPSKTLIDFFKK